MLALFLYPGGKSTLKYSGWGEAGPSLIRGRRAIVTGEVGRENWWSRSSGNAILEKQQKEVEDVEIDFPKRLSAVTSLGKFL